MSDPNNVESVHSLMADAPSTSLPNQISAGGELCYGDSKTVAPINENAWFSRLLNEFVLTTFNWSATTVPGAVLSNLDLHPFHGADSDYYPWLLWYLTTCTHYDTTWILEIEVISHAAHRGVMAISILPAPGAAVAALTDLYNTVTRFDISGGNRVCAIEIPKWNSASAKMVPFFQNYSNPPPIRGDRPSLVPFFHYLDMNLCALNIRVDTPLTASSMLPSTVTVLIKLRPSADLKFYGNARAPFFNDNGTLPSVVPQLRHEHGTLNISSY